MASAREFVNLLKAKGARLWTGVPCSILKPLLREVLADSDIRYVPAVRENVALGIASGSQLAGRPAVVLMQNSGLGNVVNALTSFSILYRVPVLIIMTWRGFTREDAPEHHLMGEIMRPMLDLMGIEHRIVGDDLSSDVTWAEGVMRQRQIPVVLVLREGAFA